MITGRSMENESSSNRLRVAVVGPEKNGKSWLFATSPGIKLDLDFDRRADALAGRKGLYALTFEDPQYPKMPETAEEIVDIMTDLEKSLDLSKLIRRNGQRLLPDAPPETIVENIAFDSISSFAKSQMEYEMYNNPALRREIKIGPNQLIYLPKSFDTWNAEQKGVEAIIMRAFALPVNVFCMFHEKAEEAPDSSEDHPKFTGRVTIYPNRYKSILKYFNEVWRVKLTQVGGKYLPRVYPLPDYSMDACTTMQLDAVEEPSIEAMIAKHRVRSGQTKTLTTGLPAATTGNASNASK